MFRCFFFQAEDGIRDGHVTGVQTCALPIFSYWPAKRRVYSRRPTSRVPPETSAFWPSCWPTRLRLIPVEAAIRSEERRVGKEGRRGGAGEGERKDGRERDDRGSMSKAHAGT